MNRLVPIHTGIPYHVFNRGNNRQQIFLTDDDYSYFLSLLRKYASKYRVTVIAYTLMPNHYHLVLLQNHGGNIPAMMNVFNSLVARRFNKLHGRTGHLFECPYKYVPIESQVGLLHVMRYLHMNPVRAGLVGDPAKWRNSNYRQFLKHDAPSTMNPLADIRLVIEAAGGAHQYVQFVRDFQEEQLEMLGGLMLEPLEALSARTAGTAQDRSVPPPGRRSVRHGPTTIRRGPTG